MDEPPHIPDLAVAMTAFDSMRTIRRTLHSVRPIARRILVVDSGSTDGTPELCRSMGAEVIHRDWPGYAAQKQFALDQCRDHRWVLLLDSDESLEPDLQESIRRTVRQDDPDCAGWTINRKVWFLGGWLHHTFHPDRVLRLVRGGQGRMTKLEDDADEGPGALHERLEVAGRIGHLPGICRHDSWTDLRELAERHVHYAAIEAQSHPRGDSALHLLVNPPAAMLKQLLLKGGFLDGRRGLIAAGMSLNYTVLKYAFRAAQRFPESEADR